MGNIISEFKRQQWRIEQQVVETLEGAVDTETGEIREGAAKAVADLELSSKPASRLDFGCALKVLKSEIEEMKEFEREFRARRKGAELMLEFGIKVLVDTFAEGEKLEDARIKLSTRKNTKVEIYDLEAIPIDFMREPVIPPQEPDKALIAEEYKKEDGQVPGARMISPLGMTFGRTKKQTEEVGQTWQRK